MSKKLYTINTLTNFADTIYNPHVKPYAQAHDIEVHNIVDDSLLSDTIKYGCMPPVAMARMASYAQGAQASGADGVLVTCTSVNTAIKLIRPMLSIPIVSIEEPVAEQAVAVGKKIGILASVATSPGAVERTIREKAAEAGKDIEVVTRVATGAFEMMAANNRAMHDQLVAQSLYELAKEVDCVVFAQLSMSMVEHEAVEVPVFKLGLSGLERIDQLMGK